MARTKKTTTKVAKVAKSKEKKERERTTIKKAQAIKILAEKPVTKTALATALGINRKTIDRWLESDADFAKAFIDNEEMIGDMVESRLFKAINDGNLTATIFYCKTKLKNRGYAERQEIVGRDGRDLVPQIEIEVIDKREQVVKTDA